MARSGSGHAFSTPRALTARYLFWGIIFILLLLVGLFSLGVYLFSPEWTRTDGDLPVGLRSSRKANYAMDPVQFSLPPLKLEILREALSDRGSSEQPLDPTREFSTLMDALKSPVPSVTPLPGGTIPTTPAPLSSPTSQPTATWLIPTFTPTPGASSTVTLSASSTAIPTASPIATFPAYFTATSQVPTIAITYPVPTRTQPAVTQEATQTPAPTQDLPTQTPGAPGTVSPTLPPPLEPSATSPSYPPPQPEVTITPAYP